MSKSEGVRRRGERKCTGRNSQDDKSKTERVRRRGERKCTGRTSQDDKLKMQGQEVNKTLPEDLVEEILARVPYPSVFKARVLSKSWLARLSPSSSQEDKQKKLLAISFQQLISERSANWKAFCPVLMSQGNLFGYDRASQTWESLPSLSFLPKNLISHLSRLDLDYSDTTLKIEGSLVLVSVWEHMIRDPPHNRSASIWDRAIFVANILTQSWKKLPPRPSTDVRKWEHVVKSECKLVTLSPDTYKVITMFDIWVDRQNWAKWVEIYDSTSATWSTKTLSMYEGHGVSLAPRYVNGMVCVLTQIFHGDPRNVNNQSVRVLLLDIKEETWRELTILNLQTSLEILRWQRYAESVVCNGKLLICFHDKPTAYRISSTSVMKLDLGLRQLSKVTQGPPAALLDLVGATAGDGLGAPIADGDCIFFLLYNRSLSPLSDQRRMQVLKYKVVAYNVQEDEWSCLPFPKDENIMTGYRVLDSSFRPGLNLFAEV